jgi:hypothetical protein
MAMISDFETSSDIAYCTIITKSHLAYARTLATTLETSNSQNKLYVLLADRVDGYIDPDKEPFHLIGLEELTDQQDIDRMCFYYTPSELCFCLRAWLHEYMFQKTSFKKWIYLDSDIIVYHSLKKISDQLDDISIMLSPHLISIEPPQSINVKAIRKLESYLLRNGGIYNGGFLALRKTEESKAFIEWFKHHLKMYGFDDRPMQSGDQLWLTCVPLYFREVSVLRDPGSNLAYWNLYERTIERDGSGEIKVNDKPLLFFHFAGFDMNAPNKLTKYGIPQGLKIIPGPIEELAKDYHRLLIENGYEETINYPYAFAKFNNGKSITPLMRRVYFEMVFSDKRFKGSPFEQYEYFRSRMHLQETKNKLRNLSKYIMNKIGRYLNPDYNFDRP